MSNQYKIIDEKNWKRAMHCKVFRNSVEPAFCVTFELDITHFLEAVRRDKISFTMAMIFAVSKCANEIEEFRCRFVDGQPVLFDRIDTAFTYLDKESELFKVVHVPMEKTMEAYAAAAEKAAEEQTEYFTGPLGNDVFQFSPMPWVTYTHISHTNSGKKDNATPLFDWGKYFEREGRILLPFSVQAHHSFVDGLHVGKLAEKLQHYLNKLGYGTDAALTLQVLEERFTVCKAEDFSQLDLSGEYCFTARTDEEYSVVCESSKVPPNITEQEDGWRCLRMMGPLDFTLTGLLAKVSAILAAAGIGIFAVSTYNTDYIFTKEENFDRAIRVLEENGYETNIPCGGIWKKRK